MARPDLQVLGGASGVAVAWPLIEELERAGRFVDDAQAWRLSLDFVRLAEMLDAAPEDDLLARAYRAVVAELRNPGTDEGNRDQDVKALMSRIRRGRLSHEWWAWGPSYRLPTRNGRPALSRKSNPRIGSSPARWTRASLLSSELRGHGSGRSRCSICSA
jgi:hypothetical protein